jgi:succinyl-diaminopimelate desuccinylase
MDVNQILSDEVIDQWIEDNREEYIKNTIDLINIKSVSVKEDSETPFGEGCAKVLDKALSLMRNFGFNTRNEKYYGIASKDEKRSNKKVGIFLHLDVVPEGNGWTYSPYDATIINNFLIGRGVGDNKGPAVAVMYALKYLEDHNLLKNTFFQYFGLAEETGMDDLSKFLEDNDEPDISIVPDVTFPVIFGEKGIISATYKKKVNFTNIVSLSVGTASNVVPPIGELVLQNNDTALIKDLLKDNKRICVEKVSQGTKVIAKGISKHAAYPDGSLNAAQVLFEALIDTNLINNKEKEEFKLILSTIKDVHGQSLDVPFEDTISGLISHNLGLVRFKDSTISINFNIRYPITSDGKLIRNKMGNKLKELGYDEDVFVDNPPSQIDPESELVLKLTEISNKYLNQDRKPYTISGGTYARKLKNGVAYGVFDSEVPRMFDDSWGGAHQPDESVYIDMFLTGIKILIKAFYYIDQYLSEGKKL